MGAEAKKPNQKNNNKISKFQKKTSKMKTSTLSTVIFVIVASFCLSNAFILHDGNDGHNHRGIPVQQKIVPMKINSLDNFLSLFGGNLPVNQAPSYQAMRKPEPNQYANWYMNNMGALAL